jgi:hypothetical protein
MRRLLVSLGVLVALVAPVPMAVLGQDATPEPAAAVSRTDMRYFVPFGPDGLRAALSVTGNVAGACVDASITLPDRPDAFDCVGADSGIYDPCFENPFALPEEPGELACIADPFGAEVVVLTVDAPLPREKEPPAGDDAFAPWDLPWALELANGDRCTLLHGTLFTLAGQTVYYSCEQNGSVLGTVDHGHPVWTVSYQADGDVASRLIEVTAAWS